MIYLSSIGMARRDTGYSLERAGMAVLTHDMVDIHDGLT